MSVEHACLRSAMRAGAFLAALTVLAMRPAAAEPPSPVANLDYRVVFRQGPDRRAIEIRRHGSTYLHRLPEAAVRAEIHYDPETAIATIFDGDDVLRMRLGPDQIAGFDAPRMMSGLSDTQVTWAPGGTREIAGASCTDHLGTGRAGGSGLTGRFCVTDDGIVLAIEIGGPGRIGRSLTADILEIGPQSPRDFDMTRYRDIEIVEPGVIR